MSELPSGKTTAAALQLMASLGSSGKGRETLLAIQTAIVKNGKILEQVELKLAKVGDIQAREAAVAKREELADAAIAKMAAMEAAFRSYEYHAKAV
jgi:hypothetical protein